MPWSRLLLKKHLNGWSVMVNIKELKTNKQMAIEHMGKIAKMMRAKTDQPEAVQFWLKHYAEMIESEIRRYET